MTEKGDGTWVWPITAMERWPPRTQKVTVLGMAQAPQDMCRLGSGEEAGSNALQPGGRAGMSGLAFSREPDVPLTAGWVRLVA